MEKEKELWDNFKSCIIPITGITKDKKKTETEKIFYIIMAEHLLKLLAVTKTYIREAQRTQSRISTKQAKNDPSTSYLNHRSPNRKRK